MPEMQTPAVTQPLLTGLVLDCGSMMGWWAVAEPSWFLAEFAKPFGFHRLCLRTKTLASSPACGSPSFGDVVIASGFVLASTTTVLAKFVLIPVHPKVKGQPETFASLNQCLWNQFKWSLSNDSYCWKSWSKVFVDVQVEDWSMRHSYPTFKATNET